MNCFRSFTDKLCDNWCLICDEFFENIVFEITRIFGTSRGLRDQCTVIIMSIMLSSIWVAMVRIVIFVVIFIISQQAKVPKLAKASLSPAWDVYNKWNNQYCSSSQREMCDHTFCDFEWPHVEGQEHRLLLRRRISSYWCWQRKSFNGIFSLLLISLLTFLKIPRQFVEDCLVLERRAQHRSSLSYQECRRLRPTCWKCLNNFRPLVFVVCRFQIIWATDIFSSIH